MSSTLKIKVWGGRGYARPLLSACTFLLVALLAAGQAGAQQYTVTPLTLGGPLSAATGINGNGQVVGQAQLANGGTHAFLYGGGAMQDLGTLGGTSWATAINSSGEVVGTSYLADGTTQHAFLYSGGVMKDLGTLGGTNSFATGINASGQAVGYSEPPGGTCWLGTNNICHAFLYSGGVMKDLGTLGGNESSAIGIADDGTVAGNSYIASGYANSHAFVYQGLSLRDLGTLCAGAACGYYSHAVAVNSNGDVAGVADVPLAGLREDAFLYHAGGMSDLGLLPRTSDSYALAIGSNGMVTGYADTSSWGTEGPYPPSRRGFLFDGALFDFGIENSDGLSVNASGQVVTARAYLYNAGSGTMTDLNTLVPAGTPLSNAYLINDAGLIVASSGFMAYLLTPISPLVPALNATKTHSGSLTAGGQAIYTVTVSNYAGAGPTVGLVTVAEQIPTGLTLVSMSGAGWACGGNTCTRSDALAGGSSYPSITVTVNVASSAPSSVTNRVTVSGGGSPTTITATDLTTIGQPPDLTIGLKHDGIFTPGEVGNYTITVTNNGAPSAGTVTVVDTLPAGLTANSISGTGWTCTLATTSCQRSDSLATATSYPSITLVVNVAANAAATVINTATVSGGGDVSPANDTAVDQTAFSPNVLSQYIADADPTAEYFRISYGVAPNATMQAIASDLGSPAWSMYAPGSTTQTSYVTGGLTSQQWSDAFTYGWRLTMRGRAPAGVAGFRTQARIDTGTHRYDMGVGYDASGVYMAYVTNRVYGPGNSLLQTYPLPDTNYHLLEMVYNPVTSSATLYVDGVSAITNYTGHTDFLSNSGMVWGVFYGPGTGNFNLVELEVLKPALSIAKTHSGDFKQGQQGAVYTISVANPAGAGSSNGAVTVTDNLPSGLTLVSMAGWGWTCSANSCSRSDALGGGSSYPPIAVTVNVGAAAPSPQVNQVTVSGGASNPASASDTTTITATPPTIGNLSPASAIAGGGPFTLTVNGNNFQVGATVEWNTAVLTTTFGSPTQLMAFVPAILIGQAGTANVAVANPGWTTSPAATFTVSSAPPLPAPPVPLSPANGATGVVVTPTLSWNAASGATSYDVYFGAASTPPLVTNTTATSYAPGTLTSGATYYWQIAARNAAGTAGSAIWSFTTGSPAAGLRFVPVTPCRVADTRGGPAMAGGSTRSFAVPQSGCGIPASAQAYSMNVTVVPEGRLSYLTLWPTGQPQAMVSTLNSWGGIVVANAAIVPAGTNGAVSVFASDPTDVILDINGYFDTSERPHFLCVLSSDAVPHRRHAWRHGPVRRALHVWRPDPRLSDSAERLRLAGHGAGVLAECDGGAGRVSGVSERVADGAGGAGGLDAELVDGEGGGQRGAGAGWNQRIDLGVRFGLDASDSGRERLLRCAGRRGGVELLPGDAVPGGGHARGGGAVRGTGDGRGGDALVRDPGERLQHPGDGGGVLDERDGGTGRAVVVLVGLAHGLGAAGGFDLELVGRRGGGERGDRAGGHGRCHQPVRLRLDAGDPGHQRVFRAIDPLRCRADPPAPTSLVRVKRGRIVSSPQRGKARWGGYRAEAEARF